MSEEAGQTSVPAGDTVPADGSDNAPILTPQPGEGSDGKSILDPGAKPPEGGESGDGGGEGNPDPNASILDPDNKAGDGEGGEGEEQKPVEYADFTLPEGIEMDKDMHDAIIPIFAANGVSQEVAQSIVDKFTEVQIQKAKENQDTLVNTVKGWQQSLTSDPKYKENLVLAQKGVARLTQEIPEVKELFSDPTFGNMPSLFKIAQFVGQVMESEATIINGDSGSKQENRLDKMYPSMTKG